MEPFLAKAATAGILGATAVYSAAFAGVCLHYRAAARRAGVNMSVAKFLRHAFPLDLVLSRWTRLDFAYYITNRLFLAVTFPSLSVLIAFFSFTIERALQVQFGESQILPNNYLFFIVFLLTGLAIRDFSSFLIHYLQHKIPILWEFHKVHHAPESLVPPTGHRLHPVDQLLGILSEAPLLGVIVGTYGWLTNQETPQLILSSIGFYTIANILTFAPLRHSHIDLRLGPLEWVILSPAHHRLHHSVEPSHWNKNFAAIFPLWDRICGTLHKPQPADTYRLGLPDHASEQYATIAACYLEPFRKVSSGIRRKGFRAMLVPGAMPPLAVHPPDLTGNDFSSTELDIVSK